MTDPPLEAVPATTASPPGRRPPATGIGSGPLEPTGPRPEPGPPGHRTPPPDTGTNSDRLAGLTDRFRIRLGKGGGDPEKVAIFVGGVVIGLTAWLARRAQRRGLTFRQPTKDEVDAFAEPAARILTHHLPLDKIDGDLVDLGRAARAAHDYITRAPLYGGRSKPALTDNPNPQE